MYVPILLVFALALLSLVAMPATGHWPAGLQLVTMAAYAVAFGLAAARLFRWE